MINKLNTKQKIIIILSGLIFIALFVLLFFITKPDNKYGDGISINNYDKYASNLPVDRRNAINSTLYKTVKNNLKSDNLDIKGATIREGTAEYNYDKPTDINSGSFIVDIQSIKQSYLISYEWSSNENNVNLSGYTATAACLPADKLIYGDFDCKDIFSSPDSDPILDYLPHSTFNYAITANVGNNNKVDLNVDIILYSSDTRDGNRDNSINRYKSEIMDWIKLKKLNPDDYLINYTING